MKNDFTLAFNEIMDARALSREIVLEAIEQALVSAYRRDANIGNRQRVEAEVDAQGQPHLYVEKEVVPDIITDQTEVLLEDARARYGEQIELGDMVLMPVTNTSSNFGRIAAQTAKQVILQRIREAERRTLYDEYKEREGDLIIATVQSVAPKMVTLSLGRAEAIMPKQHQIPTEKYRQHDKIRTYVVEVSESPRGPQIVVSRAHKDMLRRLLEFEVPEIYNGQVEVKNIAREAGQRSKVAVAALQEGIDPVGACVGMRGMRIQNIIKELYNEKIDVIEWDADPRKFISKALSPARVNGVYLDDDIDQPRTATVIVSDDQLSLAIGKEGQNARLAAKLTGWRIDIKSLTEAAFDNFAHLDRRPLMVLNDQQPDLIADVTRILEKKRNNRAVMPEEFTILNRFVDTCEKLKLSQREVVRQERRSKFDTVRNLVPTKAFNMPIATLELAEDIVRALGRIDNVGDLMIRVLSDEKNLETLLRANGAKDDAMEAIRYALDDLVILDDADEAEEEEETVAAPAETAAEAHEVSAPLADHVDEAELVADAADHPVSDVETSVSDIAPDGLTPQMWPEEDSEERARRRKALESKRLHEEVGDTEEPVDEAWEEPEEATDAASGKKGTKKKRNRVQFVYDDDMGEVIAKRRRKGNRSRNDFDEFEF